MYGGVPGSNLLNQAFTSINQQNVLYRAFSGRTLNSQRQYISGFAEPGGFRCSVQSVDRSQYVQFGLEFQRNYVELFASLDLVDLERDSAGDQFIYAWRIYQLESQGTWKEQDGWANAMAIDIGKAVADENGRPTFPDLVKK
ncbi:hypothetical protein CNR33_00041 [Pseudomonas phage tabernarius]|uniref:Uncharacterized protein n=1 Tax=Pseudomonas phage tabernarius TaxID=2048978 RepID=A0A2H4P6T5_9CAUD|nr:head protein [Pseudomonas phage tabernarius]ATW57887.1 hypothetical protein CNR33_00041 [Pseudomonas phage tabernarius]